MWWVWAAAHGAEGDTLRECTDSIGGDLPAMLERTVRIETDSGSGAGVVISPDGIVVTAAHVVAGSVDVKVFVGGQRQVAGRVVRRAITQDLALVQIDERLPSPCLPISKTVVVGSDVVAIGSPAGQLLTQSVTKGVVSGIRDVEGVRVIQTDASINPGNSGGPLLAPDGGVLGVVTFKVVAQGFEGLGFGVAASEFEGALGFRWSTQETRGLDQLAASNQDEPLPSPSPGPFPPTVELGDGVTFDPAATYRQKYRPHAVGLVVGALITGLGASEVAWTAAQYHSAGSMSRSQWSSLVLQNMGGWTMLATGGGVVGLSLYPSTTGAIRPVVR